MSPFTPLKKCAARGLTVAALSAATFALTSCSPPATSGPSNSDRAHQQLMLPRDASAGQVTENAQTCEAIGGAWRQDGMLGAYHCFEVYSDGGKSCTDTTQCEGECRADEPDATSGKCQIDSGPFGCHSQLIDGVATGFICVD